MGIKVKTESPTACVCSCGLIRHYCQWYFSLQQENSMFMSHQSDSNNRQPNKSSRVSPPSCHYEPEEPGILTATISPSEWKELKTRQETAGNTAAKLPLFLTFQSINQPCEAAGSLRFHVQILTDPYWKTPIWIVLLCFFYQSASFEDNELAATSKLQMWRKPEATASL